MKLETFRCDVCGKQKGEVNHWWRIALGLTTFTLVPWENKILKLPEGSTELHLCGAECVQRKVNEFLGAGQ